VNQPGYDLALIERIERASLWGWPPTDIEELPDGWILRATPGVDRGRSCHALTPRTRPLEDGELPRALERVRAWSAAHGIRGGLQVSPLEIHGQLVPTLTAAGWEPIWKCWVLTVDRQEALQKAERADTAGEGPPWSVTREATAEWLANWAACEPRSDRASVEAHAQTVFHNMNGRGVFGRLGESASGIGVEDGYGEWAGLFSLVVRPDLRGRGLGRRLVRMLLESLNAEKIYLQVTMDNWVALRLYESLGFKIAHSYQHLLAPVGWAA
jgi:ribosomal protein S18 acetylase RimI-like enzyme